MADAKSEMSVIKSETSKTATLVKHFENAREMFYCFSSEPVDNGNHIPALLSLILT